ncbi:rCG51456 [Rattus norvegicus]|uniref:RCG51456 n=1 Tax=Rattus norvegicus TaxID=10116 RepID=A6IZ58_RAT|nr:rCG51456 [Rattus norvegicus]
MLGLAKSHCKFKCFKDKELLRLTQQFCRPECCQRGAKEQDAKVK